MGKYVDDDSEFAGLLNTADEYEGFAEDTDESSDEGTGDQDAEDAGEGQAEDEEAEAEEAPEEEAAEEGEAEPTFEVILPGGAKVDVPLSELVAGYSRTADYTRKTQMLAAERRHLADAAAIAQALERNPQATLEALARSYNVALGAPLPDQEEEFLTDDERWRREVESRFQAQDRQQREAAIDNEIARLHHQYGDFNDEELFTYAVGTNTANLEVALQAMQFTQSQRQRAQTNGQATQKRQVKRAAGAAKGSAPAAVARPVIEEGEIRSMKDAYEYAKRVLNSS